MGNDFGADAFIKHSSWMNYGPPAGMTYHQSSPWHQLMTSSQHRRSNHRPPSRKRKHRPYQALMVVLLTLCCTRKTIMEDHEIVTILQYHVPDPYRLYDFSVPNMAQAKARCIVINRRWFSRCLQLCGDWRVPWLFRMLKQGIFLMPSKDASTTFDGLMRTLLELLQQAENYAVATGSVGTRVQRMVQNRDIKPIQDRRRDNSKSSREYALERCDEVDVDVEGSSNLHIPPTYWTGNHSPVVFGPRISRNGGLAKAPNKHRYSLSINSGPGHAGDRGKTVSDIITVKDFDDLSDQDCCSSIATTELPTTPDLQLGSVTRTAAATHSAGYCHHVESQLSKSDIKPIVEEEPEWWTVNMEDNFIVHRDATAWLDPGHSAWPESLDTAATSNRLGCVGEGEEKSGRFR